MHAVTASMCLLLALAPTSKPLTTGLRGAIADRAGNVYDIDVSVTSQVVFGRVEYQITNRSKSRVWVDWQQTGMAGNGGSVKTTGQPRMHHQVRLGLLAVKTAEFGEQISLTTSAAWFPVED